MSSNREETAYILMVIGVIFFLFALASDGSGLAHSSDPVNGEHLAHFGQIMAFIFAGMTAFFSGIILLAIAPAVDESDKPAATRQEHKEE